MKYNDISKIQAAESQLKTAIELFFKDRDSISIHTLASASQEILESLGKKKDIKSMRLKTLDILDSGDEKKRKDIHDRLWYHKNFFKHSGSENTLEKSTFNPEYTELVLWDAARLYYFITKQKVPAFIVYDLWAYSKYPEIYKLTPAEKPNYETALANVTHENKDHFLNMIHEIEKELKKNIAPNDKVLFFDNKNFKRVGTEFDQDTKVWTAYFTLNEQSPLEPEEEFILNFYLNNIWTNNITAEKVANAFVSGHKNIVGSPFVAPDNITQKAAYIIIFITENEKYSYLNMTKVSSVMDDVFAVTYSKKIQGSGEIAKNNINQLLAKDLESSVGSTAALGNISIDEAWISYLKTI